MTTRRTIEVPGGTAWIDLDVPRAPIALLVLGHGAGGGVDAPDLRAIRGAAPAAGIAVARITQPYRVAGRRAPAPAARLDEAWLAAVGTLTTPRRLRALPLITGGRSSGARVACRTVAACGARAVVALAFPAHAPARATPSPAGGPPSAKPAKSRLPELDAVAVPTLVVQGDRDPFGMPPPRRGRRVRTVHVVRGADHSLRQDTDGVAAAVIEFVTSQAHRATVGA